MDQAPPRSIMRFQWRAHRLVWDLSRGRLGRRVLGMPVLELETTGHRSGEPRSILISYLSTDAGPAIAGTNAGADRDPAWVKNLRAHPDARVREGGTWRDVRARFLEGDEFDGVWGRFAEIGDYAGYAELLTRPIPLVVLEPADGAPG